MAIDGVKILDSDFGNDIQIEILDLYDKQKSEQEIKSHLKMELQKLTEPLDIEIFMSACCLTLWEIGMLDNNFLEQLETIVNNGADKFWLDNFDSKNYEKRNTALRQLLTKVREPNKKIRNPRKYKNLQNNLFSKGEVLALNIDGEYSCIIFESFYQNRNDAYYSFVTTTYNKREKPTIDELLMEEIPVTKTKTGEIGVRKLDIYYKDIEKLKSDFIQIGTAQLDPNAEISGFSRQVSTDSLTDLKEKIEDILQGQKTEFYNYYST